MFKLAIKLGILALIAHAGIKIIPEFWTYVRFKDALTETARFTDRKSEEELLAKANKIAKELEVPSNHEPITLRMINRVTTIDTRYVAQLEYLPTKFYPWEFVIHVEEEDKLRAFR